MAPNVSTLLLLATALASAKSLNQIRGANLRYQEQSPFTQAKDNVPMTISARSEIRVSHIAEIAEADIAVHACHANRDEAEKRTESHQKVLEKHFTELGLNTTISSPPTVRDATEDNWEENGFRRRRYRKHDDDEDEEEEEKGKSFCGTTSLTVTLVNLDMLAHLRANLSAAHAEARLEYVDWRLTDATKAKKKTELRHKALAEMTEIGNDYAEVFGVDKVVPTSFDEQYGYDDRVRRGQGKRRIYFMDDDVDLSVPDVHMFTEFKFDFTL